MGDDLRNALEELLPDNVAELAAAIRLALNSERLLGRDGYFQAGFSHARALVFSTLTTVAPPSVDELVEAAKRGDTSAIERLADLARAGQAG